MFFFFVGGINQEVRQVLQAGVGRCLRCGSPVSLVTHDNVVKLFFIPVWRWPGKDSALYCDSCGFLLPKSFLREGDGPGGIPRSSENGEIVPPTAELRCWSCSRSLHPQFTYCPYCGSAQ